MSHQTELEMRDACLQASPENYAIVLQECFYHTTSTSKSVLTCQLVYHLWYIYVHLTMIYQPMGHKNSNSKIIVNFIIFWNTKLLQSAVYHVIVNILFLLYLVLQRNIMCQQNMSHEAEVLRSKRRYASKWSNHQHHYIGTKEQVHHLYYIYVRLTTGYQTTLEIKAGQESIAHLLSKYKSKLLVHLSAIMS